MAAPHAARPAHRVARRGDGRGAGHLRRGGAADRDAQRVAGAGRDAAQRLPVGRGHGRAGTRRFALLVRGGSVERGEPLAAGVDAGRRVDLPDRGRAAASRAGERRAAEPRRRRHRPGGERAGAVPDSGPADGHRGRAGHRPGRPVGGADAPGGGRTRARAAARPAAERRGGGTRRLLLGAGRAGACRRHDRAGARHHRVAARRSAAHRQPRRRAGPPGDGVQRDARPARFLVHPDAPVHGQRLPRAADPADGDPQRRRGGAARAA